MLRKVLSSFGPLSLGFALWLASQKAPEVFRGYARFPRYLGLALILFGIVVLLKFFVKFFVAWIKTKDKKIATLEAVNNELREQLNWKNLEDATIAVRRCKDLWKSNDNRQIETDTYEDDPVYLQVLLDKHLSKIVAQPIVQRLNHIKQLSFAYLSFRSATHSASTLTWCLQEC